ncbi:helix-turn-helix domain-containing protein [uncultured Jannaschia sp.]|uniref:helix-turn-helix domain-containing protein n=1 Tax=uncultured Jannaschia sp. TaxID=293347 RepID=UPI002628C83A|nr:helix-turn-helix domain-containing protein [uncultured Jannaschia sp.]
MAHVELGIEERRHIERMMNARVAVAEIARNIGRHRSTIYRELKRNRFTDEENLYLDGDYSSVAQTMAARRRYRRRKLAREPLLLASIIDRLRAGWSRSRSPVGSGATAAACTSATRRFTLASTRTKAGNGGLRAFCRTGARNGASAWVASHVRRCSRRTARSIGGLKPWLDAKSSAIGVRRDRGPGGAA